MTLKHTRKDEKILQLEDSQGDFVLKKVFVTNKEMSLNSLGQKQDGLYTVTGVMGGKKI